MIGELVNELLKEKNMTQYRLHKKSGLSKSYISELVSGKYQNPSMKTLTKLSKGLGVSVARLINDAS